MTPEPLPAHSLAEAYFFLMLQVCPACGRGPMREQAAEAEEEHIDTLLRIDCACSQCGAQRSWRFSIDSQYARSLEPTVVNPGAEPSEIIDVLEWLTLFHSIVQQAEKAAVRSEARRLGFEAALCLDEALKFYDPDNELPPSSALFTPEHQNLAQRQPERFTRSKLLDYRSKLPDLRTMQRSMRSPPKRPWWRFWGKSP